MRVNEDAEQLRANLPTHDIAGQLTPSGKDAELKELRRKVEQLQRRLADREAECMRWARRWADAGFESDNGCPACGANDCAPSTCSGEAEFERGSR